jgi:hypothetical protein
MKDSFGYVYDRGHWLRPVEDDGRLTIGQVIETALSLFALAVCLVAVIMLFLCG